MEKKPPKKVAMYLRVSTEEQVEQYGLQMQESAIRDMIKSRAVADQPLVFAGEEHIYSDEGVSGTVDVVARSGFASMYEAIANAPKDNKPFDIVAVYKIDRFARKLKILLDAVDIFKENDIEFASVTESIDTSTPFGKAMLGILGVIAELERDTITGRMQSGRTQAAGNGVHMGRTPPYGYKKENKRLVSFEGEACVVRDIFNLLVQKGASLFDIAKYLKEHQHLSPLVSAKVHKDAKVKNTKKNSDYHWQTNRIHAILTDEIYIGKYYYGKTTAGKILPKEQWKLAEVSVPQVVDNVTFAKAQTRLHQMKHSQKHTPTGNTYLLSGLLRCNHCYNQKTDKNGLAHWVGYSKTTKAGNRSFYYRCGRKNMTKYEDVCMALPLPAQEIEKHVIKVCLDLLQNPQAVWEYQQKLQSTKLEMKELERQEKMALELNNSVPLQRERILEQHKNGYLDTKKLKQEMDKLGEASKRYQNMLLDVHAKRAQKTLSDGYMHSLEMFGTKYKRALQNISENRREVQEVLNALIEEIIVYSRPLKASDKVAGPKKRGQVLPYRMHITLKLPADILREVSTQDTEITEMPTIMHGGSAQKTVASGRERT